MAGAEPVGGHAERLARGPARRLLPAIVLGVGLGGFADGIVLHQILQWHHLVSSVETTTTVDGLELNTRADGLFHAAMLAVTAAGVWLVWSRSRAAGPALSGRELGGGLLLGWGAFNVLDEVVFHALLDLHHIREGDDELAYDLAFLALAIVQLTAGSLLVRSRPARVDGAR